MLPRASRVALAVLLALASGACQRAPQPVAAPPLPPPANSAARAYFVAQAKTLCFDHINSLRIRFRRLWVRPPEAGPWQPDGLMGAPSSGVPAGEPRPNGAAAPPAGVMLAMAERHRGWPTGRQEEHRVAWQGQAWLHEDLTPLVEREVAMLLANGTAPPAARTAVCHRLTWCNEVARGTAILYSPRVGRSAEPRWGPIRIWPDGASWSTNLASEVLLLLGYARIPEPPDAARCHQGDKPNVFERRSTHRSARTVFRATPELVPRGLFETRAFYAGGRLARADTCTGWAEHGGVWLPERFTVKRYHYPDGPAGAGAAPVVETEDYEILNVEANRPLKPEELVPPAAAKRMPQPPAPGAVQTRQMVTQPFDPNRW